MGKGFGGYWKGTKGSRQENAEKKLKTTDMQFGKKVGKHAQDFGLNPSNPTSRDFVKNRANEIFNYPTEIRQGFLEDRVKLSSIFKAMMLLLQI